MHLLIAGGTGTAGRVLAARAVAAGHRVRVLSRRAQPSSATDGVETVRGDVVEGTGLSTALTGVDVVVDLSNTTTTRRRVATAFFTTGTRRLLEAEAAAGARHHVTLSVVGADRFPSGYYRAKQEQEATALATAGRVGVGCSIVRVTQFHNFVVTVTDRLRLGPLVFAPPLRGRPVHLDDVADHLLAVAAGDPTGYAPELSGPRDEVLSDLVRRYVAAVGAPLRVLDLPLPGAAGRANRAGVLRPRAGVRGSKSFDAWLQEVSCPAQPRRC